MRIMAEYSIQEVANKTNIPPHTLRFYEKEGLLPIVKRSEGGRRCFSDNEIEILDTISCLKSTGMSIRQIKSFMDLTAGGNKTFEKRLEILNNQKYHVEAQILELEQHLKKVTCKIDALKAQRDVYINSKK